MQSKSSIFIFLLIIMIPILAISTNHEIFFAVTSLLLAAVAVRYIYKQLSGESFSDNDIDDELEEELEELIHIDVKRVGIGISVAYNLLTILFLCYCAFFLDTILLKAVASLAIILQIHFIMKKIRKASAAYNPDKHKPEILLSGVLNLVVIIFTVLNKLDKLI